MSRLAMLFELRQTLRDVRVEPNAEHVFDYGGTNALRVVIRAPSADEQSQGHKLKHAFCTTSSSVRPSARNRDVFARIAANKILKGDVDPWKLSIEYLGPDGNTIRVPRLDEFPRHFQSFMSTVSSELNGHARRTVAVLRWRANDLGLHNPFSSRGLYWSWDREFWHPAPQDLSARVSVKHMLRASPSMCKQVTQMVSAGEDGPLHHDLFRECAEQALTNPRSSLVIAIAAAELAMKNCVASLVPDARWLATNVPSPPLEKMLKEYLPVLPARCRIAGKVKAPPERVTDSIKRGVSMRNQVAHAGMEHLGLDDVDDVLDAVSDVLWLLDFYCGHDWAMRFVSDRTRSELGAV